MSPTLSEPLAAYFAAVNTHDIDAMLAPFAETAVVKDEGQERRGSAAIREWIEETTRKYNVTIAVMNVAGKDGATTVTGHVSGTFPGSPVELRYVFTFDGKRIARLEIS
jgi:ketosteroid isomerase-like protein